MDFEDGESGGPLQLPNLVAYQTADTSLFTDGLGSKGSS